jgi:hypothetical protein
MEGFVNWCHLIGITDTMACSKINIGGDHSAPKRGVYRAVFNLGVNHDPRTIQATESRQSRLLQW